MLAPNSLGLVLVIAFAALGILVLIVRSRGRTARALLSVALVSAGLMGGLVAVNDYYGYYQSWGAVAADFGGGLTPEAVASSHGTDSTGNGTIRAITVAGAGSGIRRPAYVYLPPQYSEPSFRDVRFPVIELFHGTPGGPGNWLVQLRITDVMKTLMARHLIGPVVLVMPTDNRGNRAQECLNSPRAPDETYLTADLRHVVQARFRVARNPQEWAAGGYSSGGYCAANLALRHPRMYGAAFALDGYFDPNDGEAARVLVNNPAAVAANDPLRLLARAKWGQLLPAFWLAAGADGPDHKQAVAFVRALAGVEQVPFITEPGGRHNYYAWAAALPSALSWTWQQISPPALRHRFPLAGSATHVRITPGKAAGRSRAFPRGATRSAAPPVRSSRARPRNRPA